MASWDAGILLFDFCDFPKSLPCFFAIFCRDFLLCLLTSVCLSVCLFVCVSVCVSACLSICGFVYVHSRLSENFYVRTVSSEMQNLRLEISHFEGNLGCKYEGKIVILSIHISCVGNLQVLATSFLFHEVT